MIHRTEAALEKFLGVWYGVSSCRLRNVCCRVTENLQSVEQLEILQSWCVSQLLIPIKGNSKPMRILENKTSLVN